MDIAATLKKHTHITDNLLQVHVLTGCDTVAQFWVFGKGKALKGHQLHYLGDGHCSMSLVFKETSKFMSSSNELPIERDMSRAPYDVWKTMVMNTKLSVTHDVNALPPTPDAFEKNIKPAHQQCAVWLCRT